MQSIIHSQSYLYTQRHRDLSPLVPLVRWHCLQECREGKQDGATQHYFISDLFQLLSSFAFLQTRDWWQQAMSYKVGTSARWLLDQVCSGGCRGRPGVPPPGRRGVLLRGGRVCLHRRGRWHHQGGQLKLETKAFRRFAKISQSQRRPLFSAGWKRFSH